jgi:hypothetical protein
MRTVCQIEENYCRCRKTAVCEMSLVTGTYRNISVPTLVCENHLHKFSPYVGNYVRKYIKKKTVKPVKEQIKRKS